MCEIEVGDRAGKVRGEGICQAGSHQSDVLIAIDGKPNARCCGSDIKGFGEGVVKIELHSVTELFPQVRLQRVITRAANRTPSIRGDGLVSQKLAGAILPQTGAWRPEEIRTRADVV